MLLPNRHTRYIQGMAVITRDVFGTTTLSVAYRDVFSPAPGIITDPTPGVGITDALLTEQGELLLLEDGVTYLALEVGINVS